MFHLDNNSGIDVMPVIKQTLSRLTKWFTEGDNQTPPSYPGADWFNIVQAELLNVLKEAEITPAKNELNQLSKSIIAIIDNNKIKINDASLTTKGVVQLSSATNSESETEAATSLAVKTTYDFAVGVKKIADTAVKKGDEYHYYGALGDKIINNLGASYAGVYFQNTYSEAYPERGYPIRDAGALIVLRTEGDGDQGCVQIYTLYKSGRQFIRNYRGNAKNGYWEPWVEQITTANADLIVPVGVPLPYPLATPPAGFFLYNGSKFDTVKNPKLAKLFPNGYLLDLRGQFIRAWDDGRGLDPGRAILSYQGDAMRNLWGEISPVSESFASAPIATGAFGYFDKIAGHTPTAIDNGSTGGFNFNAERIVPVSYENRPINIAFNYIVKAG